jgi:uncharacterized protein YaiL (DUF2058 family)
MIAALAALLPGLGGLKSLGLGFAAGLLAGGLLALKVTGWQEAAAERDRLRWQLEARRLAAAASHAAELADRDRALLAAEAAAAAEQARQADLETLIEELRHAPPEDDRPLSPTAQRYFDGLREQ